MAIDKLRGYIIFTGLGFVAAIAVGLFVFFQFRGMMTNYSEFSKRTQKEYIDHLNTATLESMTEYIEKRYPVLKDTGLLKREAGTDWFWNTVEEWRELTAIFNLAYIYYVEKKDNNYLFLMSSGIERDELSEWIGSPVWAGTPPAYIDDAWNTKRVAFSSEPVTNEWGTHISVGRPVFSGEEVAGILGIDYDISFMDEYVEREFFLKEQEKSLLWKMRNILAVSIILIIGFMCYQIWLSASSVMIPVREMEADERTRIMLDATPMLCTLRDMEGRLLDCNRETLRVTGFFDKAECLENYSLLQPEFQPNGKRSQDEMLRYSKAAIETGYQRFDWAARTVSKEDLPMESTMVRVPWKNSWRLACYSRDLREIRAKEALVNETEERLRIMLDTMEIASLFFDHGENLIDCNLRAVTIFGIKSKQELIENFFRFSPRVQPDGRLSVEKAQDCIRSAFRDGRKVFRWDHLKADGTPLPAEVTLIRVAWKDGYRLVSYTRDLSKLIETEDNLKRVLTMAEVSPNPTFYLEAGLKIGYMNPAVSGFSGFSREELLEKGLELLFSPEDFRRFNTEYLAAAREKDIVAFEMPMTAKNGERHDFYFFVFAMEMYDGTTGFGLLGRDITESRRMHLELAAAKEQAERALESEVRYNKAKSDFLSKVSHELRTPLNTIIGMVDIARMTNERTALETYCNNIKSASEHLLQLVNDILDLTGFDTGNFDFTSAPFSFGGAIKQIFDTAAQKAKARNQIFRADIDGGIHDAVTGDERRLKQVLLNLLSNAIKFTPEKGSVDFSVRMLENDGNECTVRFEIADNGIGIAPDALRRMGEAFEQADNSITREYGGMGLGLSLTKRIISLMRGSLRVESEYGKGSRFICDIRLGIAGVSAGNRESGGEAAVVPETVIIKGKRVLVVDDVEINREVLVTVLEDFGAVLDEAENGEEALKMCLLNKYDLVLMDLHMPVMDGFTAVREIRASALPWVKTIPVISISAECGAELLSKTREAGINGHLAKPVEIESLLEMISKYLR